MWCYESTSVSLRATLLTIACLVVVYGTSRKWRFPAVRRLWRRLAARPAWCALILFSASFLISLTLTLKVYPRPWIHDEPSYLLAADTFADGRVTNAAHPMWVHLESFHVLGEPTYMSKYPPGNAAFLGAGQLATGHAIVGSWFMLALGVVALYWMLRGWLPPKWALLGGLLLAVHVPMLKAWSQTYWGGSLQLIGGALVFGAMRRILNRPTLRDGILLAMGAMTLAVSRPMEGLLICAIVSVLLVIWLLRRNSVSFEMKFCRVVLPGLIISCVGFAGLLWYNAQVTGSPLQLPYSLHSQQYKANSMVWWSALPEVPQYNHQRFEDYYVGVSRARHSDVQSFGGYLQLTQRKLLLLWKFFPLAGGLCLLALPMLFRRRWVVFAVCVVGGVLLLHLQLTTTLAFPHYLAPIAGLFFFLTLAGLRYWQIASHWKPRLAIVPCVVVFYSMLHIGVFVASHQDNGATHPRAAVESQLEATEGKHLVVVCYDPTYTIHLDWVYNRANIDDSKIVWARDMGAEKNEPLFEYFGDRQIWYWHLRSNDDHDLVTHDVPDVEVVAVD